MKKVRDDSSEDAVAREWRMQQRYKKARFCTYPKTFSTWTGFGFSLDGDDKKGGEVEEGEEKRRKGQEKSGGGRQKQRFMKRGSKSSTFKR